MPCFREHVDGRVDVDPLKYDDIYVAKVYMGNPAQLVRLGVDTASSDL